MTVRRIKLQSHTWFLEHGTDIPGFVWRERPFVFQPQSFALSDERLQPKVISDQVQIDSLERFESNPDLPVVYAVASEPSDSCALYFAAYLCQLMLDSTKDFRRIHWEPVYADFKNDLLYSETSRDLLVLTGLTPNSTSTKLEKARDLLSAYSHIPRIVVIAGEDPITFMARKMYFKTNSIFFHSAKIMRRRVEVI